MTPDQALQVLDQVTQNVPGTRKDHETVQQAIEILRKSLTEGKCEKCPNQ